jgi:hypothetical protein
VGGVEGSDYKEMFGFLKSIRWPLGRPASELSGPSAPTGAGYALIVDP